MIVAALADKGVAHKSHRVAIETAKLIPGIFMPYLQGSTYSTAPVL